MILMPELMQRSLRCMTSKEKELVTRELISALWLASVQVNETAGSYEPSKTILGRLQRRLERAGIESHTFIVPQDEVEEERLSYEAEHGYMKSTSRPDVSRHQSTEGATMIGKIVFGAKVVAENGQSKSFVTKDDTTGEVRVFAPNAVNPIEAIYSMERVECHRSFCGHMARTHGPEGCSDCKDAGIEDACDLSKEQMLEALSLGWRLHQLG